MEHKVKLFYDGLQWNNLFKAKGTKHFHSPFKILFCNNKKISQVENS